MQQQFKQNIIVSLTLLRFSILHVTQATWPTWSCRREPDSQLLVAALFRLRAPEFGTVWQMKSRHHSPFQFSTDVLKLIHLSCHIPT